MLSVKFRQSHRKFSGLLNSRVLTILIIFLSITGCKEDPLIDRSFVTDQPCSAPCWQGIIINKSSLDDVTKVLKELSFVESSSIRVRDVKLTGAQEDTEVAFDCSHPKQKRCGVIILRNDKAVYISLSVGYPLSLKEVVDKLGVPDYVTSDLYHPEAGGCVLSMEYINLGIVVESFDRQSEKNCHALESGEGLNPKIKVDGLRYQSPVEPHESSCMDPGCVRWPGFEKP
jgi:hypothetical protein